MKLYVERVCGYSDDYEKVFEVQQQDGCARVTLSENLIVTGKHVLQDRKSTRLNSSH